MNEEFRREARGEKYDKAQLSCRVLSICGVCSLLQEKSNVAIMNYFATFNMMW